MQTSVELQQRIEARQRHEAILSIRTERHARKLYEYHTAQWAERWAVILGCRTLPAAATTTVLIAAAAYLTGNGYPWVYTLAAAVTSLAAAGATHSDQLRATYAQQRAATCHRLRGWVEQYDDETLNRHFEQLGPLPTIDQVNTALYDYTVAGRW